MEGSRVLIVIVSFLGMACASIGVQPLPTPETQVSIHRGTVFQTRVGQDFTAAVHASNAGGEVLFTVSILNRTPYRFLFQEDRAVSMEAGDARADRWHPAKIFTATEYFEREKNKALFMAALAGASMGLASARVSAAASSGSTTEYLGALVNRMEAKENMERTVRTSANRLVELSKSLLYTNHILPGKVYTGQAYAPLPDAPEFKLVLDLGPDRLEFLFRRDDAEEFRNPWGPYLRDRIYLGYLYTLDAPLGFSIGYLTQSFSFFWDNAFQLPDFRGHEDSLIYTYDTSGSVNLSFFPTHFQGQETAFLFETVPGVHFRFAPYFWYSLGVGYLYRNVYRLYLIDYTYHTDELKWFGQTNPTHTAVFQTGLLGAVGPFFAAGNLKYRLGPGFAFSVAAGFAF